MFNGLKNQFLATRYFLPAKILYTVSYTVTLDFCQNYADWDCEFGSVVGAPGLRLHSLVSLLHMPVFWAHYSFAPKARRAYISAAGDHLVHELATSQR